MNTAIMKIINGSYIVLSEKLLTGTLPLLKDISSLDKPHMGLHEYSRQVSKPI